MGSRQLDSQRKTFQPGADGGNFRSILRRQPEAWVNGRGALQE